MGERIASRQYNLIMSLCKVKREYTVHDIDRALESRQRTRERYRKYGVDRPTHKEVEGMLIKLVLEHHAIVIEPGRPGKATKYRWSDEDGEGGP